jgi:hypothetical protein
MDGLLREIQMELAPDREPAPALSPQRASPLADAGPDPEPEPEPESAPGPPPAAPIPTAVTRPPTPDPQIHALTELSAHLLASIRELLAGYERVMIRPSSPEPPTPPSAPPRVRRRPDDSDVTLSAAPFASLEALHEFEQAVASLPGVREVAVRGYEGTDRAIIEVRLRAEDPAPRGQHA